MAAKAGATYVSPFIGRLGDIGHEGMQIVRDIVEIYSKHNYKTEVIVASIRHPLHVIDGAKAGAHVATIPFNVIEKMFKHPLTDNRPAKVSRRLGQNTKVRNIIGGSQSLKE